MGFKRWINWPTTKIKTGRNGKKYKVYIYPNPKGDDSWSGMDFFLFILFWAFVLFPLFI